MDVFVLLEISGRNVVLFIYLYAILDVNSKIFFSVRIEHAYLMTLLFSNNIYNKNSLKNHIECL